MHASDKPIYRTPAKSKKIEPFIAHLSLYLPQPIHRPIKSDHPFSDGQVIAIVKGVYKALQTGMTIINFQPGLIKYNNRLKPR